MVKQTQQEKLVALMGQRRIHSEIVNTRYRETENGAVAFVELKTDLDSIIEQDIHPVGEVISDLKVALKALIPPNKDIKIDHDYVDEVKYGKPPKGGYGLEINKGKGRVQLYLFKDNLNVSSPKEITKVWIKPMDTKLDRYQTTDVLKAYLKTLK